ncbi:MAG TPA: DUF2298 domain-containing protein [Patescibacteria group bacterium]|nr:DUF2298 domain-containing protein [Patescibacteria group bacterium]
MEWVGISIRWYFMLLVIGIISYPAGKLLFSRFFPDHGFAFAKIIGILSISYVSFVLSWLHIASFSRTNLVIIGALWAIFNLYLFTREKGKKSDSSLTSWIIIEEVCFILLFLSFAYIRGQESSIRDLEKFMDFGFMNSILRSSYFPPPDMWLAGESINYYYFGHLIGAVLTKLSGTIPAVAYNLILATLFGVNSIAIFSLVYAFVKNMVFSKKLATIAATVGSFLVNLGGNLHTIYLFTKGYPNEEPVPFWKILSGFNPTKYWYPNATRFIPFTIHEFPIYSYVVADLHGHVYDIPFVILSLAVLAVFFLSPDRHFLPKTRIFSLSILIGFLGGIHYMTNAFDGPIYIILALIFLFLIVGRTYIFLINAVTIIVSFLATTLPFSLTFSPFVGGIGVNCAPSFLTKIKKFGPFLFEAGNCQISPFWMLPVLWGFFWFNFIFFLAFLWKRRKNNEDNPTYKYLTFILVLFLLSLFLTVIPEFFYIKDIYPAHFRANTMFKLGYQAFIMMGIASSLVFALYKAIKNTYVLKRVYLALFLASFALIASYPYFAISSYYGKMDKKPELRGDRWLTKEFPSYGEIVEYLKINAPPDAVILEAQGDSYTTFNSVSAYTGMPTIAGWWVHEWLWRGSSDVVGKRIPDIEELYKGTDLAKKRELLDKYAVRYIIIGPHEEEKYKNIQKNTISQIAPLVFVSSDKKGEIYEIR